MDYVNNYKLDARPDRIDLRDRQYNPPVRGLAKRYPSEEIVEHFFPLYAKYGMVLDQGTEGACTGFGLAAMINYLLIRRDLEAVMTDLSSPPEELGQPTKVSKRMLYHLARFYDEWPGEDYEGSSCRGAVKAWHKHGVCKDDLWPYRDKNKKVTFIDPEPDWDIDAALRPLGVYYRVQKDALTDMQAAIQEVGALYVSAKVHKGWNMATVKKKASHKNLPMINWQAGDEETGGHAFALVGYNEYGFIVQNSWGDGWGLKGFALLAYDDWVKNGTDAWVCVMGVPKKVRVPSHYIASTLRPDKRGFDNESSRGGGFRSTKPSDHVYQDEQVKCWSDKEAYNHTVVMGNDGQVMKRLVTKDDAQSNIDQLVYNGPKQFFGELNDGGPPRLAIYAHGGLNSEASSIERIKVVGPYFKANGIYPLFFTWRTGVGESLFSILQDAFNNLFGRAEGFDDFLNDVRRGAEDVLDRTLEIASTNLGVKSLWSQIKQNAAEAAKKGSGDRGVFLTTLALKKLLHDFPTLEIHLAGHSAGAHILGNMLGDFPRNDLSVKSFTLYAPACSLNFANRRLLRAMENGVLAPEDLHLHILSERLEQDDTVGPYRKSLLYLISRALEDFHKTPLLGLANALDPQNNNKGIWSPKTISHLKKWQKLDYWNNSNIHLLDNEYVVSARSWSGTEYTDIARIDSAHDSFDNDVEVLDKTLCRILGTTELVHKVENLRF